MSTKMLTDASLKAVSDVATQQHTLDFYMLAFSDVPDKQGDIIAPTAADEWLKSFYAAGVPLPISFTHAAVLDSQNPFNIIGYAPADEQHVFKDDHGIRVIANLDTDTNPTAQQVFTLANRHIVTGASVAYFTTADGQKLMKDGSTLITRIDDILECGPCLDPANEDAYVIAVKAMEAIGQIVAPYASLQLAISLCSDVAAKAGRKLSAANRQKLRAAQEVISELLSLDEDSPPEQATKANTEEPVTANVDEPGPNAWLREQLDALSA